MAEIRPRTSKPTSGPSRAPIAAGDMAAIIERVSSMSTGEGWRPKEVRAIQAPTSWRGTNGRPRRSDSERLRPAPSARARAAVAPAGEGRSGPAVVATSTRPATRSATTSGWSRASSWVTIPPIE